MEQMTKCCFFQKPCLYIHFIVQVQLASGYSVYITEGDMQLSLLQSKGNAAAFARELLDRMIPPEKLGFMTARGKVGGVPKDIMDAVLSK